MSDPGPLEGRNPFEGLSFLGDVARMLQAQGPVNWDVARQVAQWVATEGASEANVDPLERIRLEELLRVAELRVADVTGLSTSATGRALTVVPVGRGDWALRALDAWRPLLESLALALTRGDMAGDDTDDDGPPDPTGQFLGNLADLMGPLLVGMQSGVMVGHLAHKCLGQYDLPVPRPPSDELVVVLANVDAFADEWSLPRDDARLWVCLHEVAHHAVISRPHVRERLDALLKEYTAGFEVDPDALEGMLAGVDPSNPASFQTALGDPETLLGAMQTPAQREVLARLSALTAAVEGYVDHVMDGVGEHLIGSYGQLTEALRRRRVEAGPSDRFVERLLGMQLDRRQFERGAAFINGVVERAGEEGLLRLWHSEHQLPTPAEVDAPGLWLARIDLPD